MATDRINASPSPGRKGPMHVGEQRSFTCTSGPGDGRTITVTRTARAYAEDLADAYNEELRQRNPNRSDEVEFYVDGTGQIRLGDRQAWLTRHSRHIEQVQEASRQDWKRRNRLGEFSDPRQMEMER